MSPQESFESWSIPTEQLTGPRKTGGLINIGGLVYQETFACLYLARLMDPSQVFAVRYEGSQDLDLFYADGSEKYVQLKNEPQATYTLKKLAPILKSFAIDLANANLKESLGFELVAKSNHIDAAVSRLCNHEPSEADFTEVVRSISEIADVLTQSAPFKPTNAADWFRLTEQLLKQTTLRFGMGDEIEGRLSFESHACTELARYGIAGSDLQGAFEALQSALRPQQTFLRADVQEALKRFLGGAAIDLFGHRVEILADDLLSRPSSREEIRQFYEGEKLLDWSIIAAGGDIARDQQSDLVKQLCSPPDKLRIVCLVAEPGAGKSTLVRRLAAELHRRYNAMILRLKVNGDAEPWYLIPQFHRKIAAPFYVLADDLFRSPAVVAALHELSTSLPVTILATSRESEYRPGPLKSIVLSIPLAKPSQAEKASILRRLGKPRENLTPAQRARLDGAKQFLALMMEATEGKELREIVRDTLTRLRAGDESTYRAYEYVCFSYRNSILIPESLLDRLDSAGRFHKLPDREEGKGIVFYDEGRPGFLSAGHPVLAETAWGFYNRASSAVLTEIANTIDSGNPQERHFIALLLTAMARTTSAELMAALPGIVGVIEECQGIASISELITWRTFHKIMGRHAQAEACVDIALSLIPATATECNALLGMFRDRGRERDALPILADWVNRNPDSHGDRTAYLNLVHRFSTAEEKHRVIEETHKWLARHEDDASARERYLVLTERWGTSNQLARAIKETSSWLVRNDHVVSVRGCYLSMVKRKGTPEQTQRVLQETSVWLTRYSEDTFVRGNYLSLVARKGTAQDIERVLNETAKWLAQHDTDTYVRSAYLLLLERSQNSLLVAQVLIETKEWLIHHDDDTAVRTTYLGMIERNGSPHQVAEMLHETNKWLAQHEDDTSLRTTYLGVMGRKGMPSQFAQVLLETKQWLRCHSTAQEVWETLIASLISLGETDESADLIQQAISYNPSQRNLVSHYIRFLKKENDEQKVRHAYLRLLKDFPQDEDILRYFGDWLREHNSCDEARAIYERLMEKHPADYRLHYSYGRLALKEQKLSEAIIQFQKTLKLRPDHQLAHEGLAKSMRLIGELAEKQGKQEYADRFFLNAEEKYRRAIDCAAEKEQPEGRFYAGLGWFYISRARYEDAHAAFESALIGKADYWEYYWGAGTALFRLGQFRAAADALRVAAEVSPDNLQPPASEEIPQLFQRCLEALGQNDDIDSQPLGAPFS